MIFVLSCVLPQAKVGFDARNLCFIYLYKMIYIDIYLAAGREFSSPIFLLIFISA